MNMFEIASSNYAKESHYCIMKNAIICNYATHIIYEEIMLYRLKFKKLKYQLVFTQEDIKIIQRFTILSITRFFIADHFQFQMIIVG